MVIAPFAFPAQVSSVLMVLDVNVAPVFSSVIEKQIYAGRIYNS